MKKKKIFGWVCAIMCVCSLFSLLAILITISSSTERQASSAIDRLPGQLFMTVAMGWLAYWQLGKHNTENNQPVEQTPKIGTGLKWVIYLCEAVVVILGSSLVGILFFMITGSNVCLQVVQYASILIFIYLLPNPQQLYDYWQKRKQRNMK